MNKRPGSELSKFSSGPQNARAKSCTRCRQAKLACDARRTRVNEPCSRCRLKGFDCRFDANFKRVSTRKLTEELHQKLYAPPSAEKVPLRESVSLQLSQDPKLSSLPEKYTQAQWTASEFVGTLPKVHMLPLGITNNDIPHSYKLGKIQLESQIVADLFQHFSLQYYPYALFLQPLTSPSDLLTRSPQLFWTILMIASQDHAQFACVYQHIATEHEGLLAPIFLRAIQRIETVHALLLLCLWPIPQSRNFHNPAWNYVGLAINAAMQLNCHSPLGTGSETHGWTGLSLVAVGELSTVDQSRTWLGCFWVGTVVAAFYGFPPPMSTRQQMQPVDKAVITVLNSIPSWWGTLFSILKITNMIVDTLGSMEDCTLHFSITRIFDDQLDELKRANSDSWRSELEIEWCNAKIYLYALTFTIPANTNQDQNQTIQLQIHRQEILHKVLEPVSNLITEIAKLGQQNASDLYPCGLLTFVPKPYFTSLFNATTFLFRFMATSTTRTPSQETLAMKLTVEAHKIFQSFLGQRELTRAAIHIEMLIDILKYNPTINMTELVVNNKLGASVMFDAVFQACRQRNIDPRTGKVLDVKEWKTVNETFAERLPDVLVRKWGDENDEVDGAGSYENSGLEKAQQSSGFEKQNSSWWGEWENYMDLFQVGVEEWGAMDMEPSADGYANLGGQGSSAYE